MTIDAIEQRLEDLELRYMEQERLLDSLNDVLTNQQQRLMSLEKQNRSLKSLVEDIRGAQVGSPKDEPPPPHY